MRIRSTKPEFWRSERIATVDWDDRFVLKGLESYVDDNGVGKDDIALIVGDLFQRDMVREPSRTLARVSEAISRLSEAGLVWRYRVNGTALLYVSFWESIQRVDKPQSGRFPRPDGTMNYKDSLIRESVATPREDSRTFAPGTGEQGNRGTGEQDDDEPLPPEPPPGPYDELQNEVVVEAPRHIDNPSKAAKRFASSAAKTLVRQELGGGYPRATVERLAVQVDKLINENHPDTLIRAAVREWEQRPNCDRPEYLPTVLGDLVKASRVNPASNVTAFERKKANNAAIFQALATPPEHPELMP